MQRCRTAKSANFLMSFFDPSLPLSAFVPVELHRAERKILNHDSLHAPLHR